MAKFLPPPKKKKKLLNLCFSLLLDITAVPRDIENNSEAKFGRRGGVVGEGGANKVHYGRCSSGECGKNWWMRRRPGDGVNGL